MRGQPLHHAEPSGGLTRLAAAALGAVLAAGVALFAVVAVKMLTYPHEVIVTEAAVGLAVQSLLDGLGLYDAARWLEEPFDIIHYTPLYYLITAAWVKLFGGGLFAGRWISILATTGSAMVAGHMVRKDTGSVAGGLAASALWLSFYQVVFWGTTQRVDALGTFFEALGIMAFMLARRKGRAGYSALPWFVAAWSTKQVMVVAITAATLDLFLDDRRSKRPLLKGRAIRFAAAGGGALVAIFLGLTLISGGGFWTAVVEGTVSGHADTPWVIFSNAELFFGSPWNMVTFMTASILALFGLAGKLSTGAPVASSGIPHLSGVMDAPRPGGEGTAPAGSRSATGWSPFFFLGLYLWLGLALAIATDANLPRFFPPMLAMAMILPLGLHRLRRRPELTATIMAVLVFTGGFNLLYEMRSLVRERVLTLHEDNDRLRFAATASRLAPGGGPALAQDAGLLISAGLPVVMADPYVFSILAGNDAWQPGLLAEGVRRRRYELVVLNRPVEELNDHEWTTLWIAPVKEDLQQNYRLAETLSIDQEWRFLESTRYYYVPRDD
jgi:4-amino-4-deoxy-L-arabinose transferase-like glycosyltransferase